ncbi:YncE family protein [Clostridium swellfunianum]|uniref:YVTN family beta-propeller repeat protein n=1 Tax=Clostridium swellfunianum TaxID=1367462 RepID=UPI00202FB9DA|nr:YncE family protein [Clostridium swellfunianum]MCM0647270.1 YncE family protein [Clostridium swellfunianum]
MFNSKYFKLIGSSVVLTLTLAACSSTVKNNTQAPKISEQNKAETKVEQKVPAYIYTANESGSISKIDVATNKVVETFKDEGSPHNVQVSPDGKVFAYTSAVKMAKGQTEHGAMSMNGSAVFYDVETGKQIRKVEVGKHPAHIVFTEDGKYAIVTNNEDNNVSIIDAKTYKLINNVIVGKGPHGFRISADSQYAYIANMGEDTVSIVDITNIKEVKKIKVGKTPVTTGLTSDGKTLVATVNAENYLAVVDLSTDKIEKIAVGVGPAQVYLSTDDKYAFVANQGTEKDPSNTITKVNLTTKQVVATIEAGKGAHGVVVSPDNKFVYVTNMYEATVSVIDNETNKVVATIPVDEEPNGISFKK